MRVARRDAESLAYYESGDGIGVLGPRGWFCQGISGASGASLYVIPLDSLYSSGEVIRAHHIDGSTSGRFKVAEIMIRVFPAFRQAAVEVLESFDFPIPNGPHPGDKMTYRGKTIAEYVTPAHTVGLGNDSSVLGKNEYPIKGVAIVLDKNTDGADLPDVLLLSVRLAPVRSGLAASIVREFER